MRFVALALAGLFLVTASVTDAQTKKSTRKPAPAKTAPEVPPTRIPADVKCSSELGIGVETKRRFCDVLTGADPKEGVIITIPPHRGPVMLAFQLHNRHTYSAELVKLKQAYRKY